ncbi:WD repeat-containing protein 93-like [Tubulanus polymorphus]|uniref:WD repeat-containing protein 93-like n=1 Tax=Tubulanus polymorphus TaxID=672921 RepID=UPI003DA22F17
MDKMAIPPPSHMDGIFEDSDFIQDPELVWAVLPQPFRMVDKIVNNVFDNAWEIIMNEEMRKEAERAIVRPPKFEAAREMKVQGNVNYLEDSGDGYYVFVGLPTGLAAIDSSNDETIAQWEEDNVAIMNVTATVISERIYLLCTIDDMGIARLFAFSNGTLYFIKKLNDQEGEKKVIAHKCEPSSGGDYIGIALENSSLDEWWLDVYQCPKEAWLKELENLKTIANKQISESSKDLSVEKSVDSENNPTSTDETSEVQVSPGDDQVRASHESSSEKQINHKFTAVTQIMRVKSGPREISASHANSATQALKSIESPDIIASGENHLLTSASLSLRKQVFDFQNEKYLPFATADQPVTESIPTFHFLTAGKVMPIGLEQNPGTVAYVAVWWNGGSQMKTYSLLKTAKDLERKPDIVWPFSQNIAATAVSPCNASIAIGLQNGTIVLWDKYLGIQRKVFTVPAAPARLKFLDTTLGSEENNLESASYLIVNCVSGDTQLVPCGIKTDKDKEVLQVIPRAQVLKNKPVRFMQIKTAPDLAIVTLLDGNIYICDILKGRRLCEVHLPETHRVTDTWNPVLTTTVGGKHLYVRGTPVMVSESGEENEDEAEEEELISSSLFVFELDSLRILSTYWQNEQKRATFPRNLLNLNDRVTKILKERIKSQPNRRMRMQESWKKLQDHLTSSKNLGNKNRTLGDSVRFA